MIPPDIKNWIDNATFSDLVNFWGAQQNGGLGWECSFFNGEVGEYYGKALERKRNEQGKMAKLCNRHSKGV